MARHIAIFDSTRIAALRLPRPPKPGVVSSNLAAPTSRRTALTFGATMNAVPASAEQDGKDPGERQGSRRPAAVANATAAARGCAAARHAHGPARARTAAEAATSAPARSGEDNPAAHAAVDRAATRGAPGSRADADGLELQPV